MSVSFSDAVSHFQSGHWPEAIAACRSILRIEPTHVDSWQMLGLALCHSGHLTEATKALETALAHRADDFPTLNNLGEVYRQLGRLSDAEAALRRAMTLQPRFAEAAFNLGNTLRDAGRPAEAVEAFQKAVMWRPAYAKAHLNLANTLRAEGRLPRAAEHYEHYLRLRPAGCEVLLSLAGVYSDLGEHSLARKCTAKAASIEPDSPAVITALGNLAVAEGDVTQGRNQFGRLARLQPKSLLPQLRVATMSPVIPEGRDEIEESRDRLVRTIADLDTQRLEINTSLLHVSGAEPPMAWAYQGLWNRPLKEAYAGLFRNLIQPPPTRDSSRKPHVGIVVTDGHEGVYAECLGRLVNHLPNAELDVSVVCSPASSNILNYMLGESRVPHFLMPSRVDESAKLLREASFDLLHYWEIGTDSLNYFLPFLKPAPLQSACWGWPVTSGIPTVDFFVSSELIETDQADSHYSEKLIRLPTLPTWYKKPPVPARLRTRDACGLPSHGRIYLCTQNLRKYHPDFDELLGALLRQDTEGWLCIIEDTQPAITNRLRQRLQRRLPEFENRIIFLRRQSREDYLHIVSQADVILDTLHYGGGANSLYDAFACGTPVISHPGIQHRSRYALAATQRMRLPELIATSHDDYVTKAVNIAQTPDLRNALRKRIQQSCDLLFEDTEAIESHRTFFLKAVTHDL